jgi:tetratricopeptide (TPR) repeat protein
MAKVYVSSTVADLAGERRAVMDWLVAAGHQPVHSYRPDSETVRASCLDDIARCDLYVLILGHRYGFQPQDGNPDQLSITHLEFRRAGELRVPRVALLRTSVPDVRLSDLLDPSRAGKVNAFIDEVRKEVRPGEFSDREGLINGLSTAVQHELDRLAGQLSSARTASVDSRVIEIVATLTRALDEQAAENVALRGRITELEAQLKSAVERTVQAAAQPGASDAAIRAADALEAGQTRLAEELLATLERLEAAQIGGKGRDDKEQQRAAARLAREQGALAMSHDVRAALAAYERAAQYEPDDTWTRLFIGDLLLRLGDSRAAMAFYRRGLAIAEAATARDPGNADCLHDVFAGHNRIGDALIAQGDGPGGMTAYRKALEIADALNVHDSENTVWQRDVAVSHQKIGDVLVAQGDAPAGLASYRKALGIVEALAGRDPTNALWRRDLSVSHNKVGNVLAAQGDVPGGMAAYRKGLAIAEALARTDSANTEWQRDAAVCHNRIGDVLVAQGDTPASLAAYRNALTIVETLAARDPSNTQWQRDVSVLHNRIGRVLVALGDEPGGLAAFREGLAIAERLAALDPTNDIWRQDVTFSRAQVEELQKQKSG